MILGEPSSMCDVLCRLGARPPFTGERLLDVLATTGKGHHLLARVAAKLPSSVSSGDPDFVSKLLNLAGQFGAVNCGREDLRAIDFNGIEAAPLSVRAAGHVGDDDVRVKVRVGTVAVFNSTGRPSGNVIEARGDDIAGHNPFAAASAARERVLFEFSEGAVDCHPVCLDKAGIVSDQALDAHRLRCVEGRVPAGTPVPVAVRLMNEYLTGSRTKPTQYSAEVLGRNLAGESQLLSGAAEPIA